MGGFDAGPPGSGLRRTGVLFFCGAVFLFQLAMWNARLGNSDTYEQLIATVHLVGTGDLGVGDHEFHTRVLPIIDHAAPVGSASTAATWVRGRDGRWYQAHDPGNKVLMTPAAVLTRLMGQQLDGRLSPSAATRTLAAASIVGFGLLLPLFLFWALAIVMSAARAMRWAALGMVATILLPYSKQTWDVFPCAVFVAGIAWLTMRRFSARHPSYGTSVAMFLMAGAASWFRFSLAPFVLLGCCLVELLATRRADAERVAREAWMRVGLGVVAFLALLLPVFAHNALVTGNPVRPPTARFELNQLWVHFPLGGAVGLLASPNRGLVWFSPIFVVAVALTWTWRSLPDTLHSYVLAWGLPLGSYILAVGSVQNWGAFGWGPRYLVPTLPLVWVPVAVVGARAMTGSSAMRLATITLLGLSIALAGLATLTNWDAVAATGSDVVAKSTAYPKQIIETARYVGRRIPVEDDSPADSGIDTKRWPDLAVLYTTRKAGLPDPAGYAAFLALVASASWLFVAADRRLRASDLEHRGAPAIRWRR